MNIIDSIIPSGYAAGTSVKITANNATQLTAMKTVKDVAGGVLIAAKDTKGKDVHIIVPRYFLAAA